MRTLHLSLLSLFASMAPLMAAAPAAAVAGAAVAWTTYEAEQAAMTTGEKLSSRAYGEIANEALDHACVRLAATNQFITWKVTKPANAFVVRACVPDTPDGGGADYTLTVAINGVTRQKVTISSKHSWLYGADPNGNDNKPGTGTAHAFFDESHALLSGAPLNAGDTFTLYKQATDAAGWYVIDLVDLEWVEAAPPMPAGFLSVTEFGARPDDGVDDSAALKACVDKAKADGKGVWLPAGLFHQTEVLALDQVRVRGSGSWHTRLTSLGQPQPNLFKGNLGFHLVGTGVEIAGVAVDGALTTRSTDAIQHGLSGSGEQVLVDDLWIRHTNTGIWIGPCSKVTVRRCRFRDTYADGINLNNHSEDVVVEQNHSRGNGDDGFAIYSGTDKSGAAGPCRNVSLRNNTAEGQRWGNGLGLYGGDTVSAENNVVRSANRVAGITVSSGFKSWPIKGASIVGNVFIDCGGTAFSQKFPAIDIAVPGADVQQLRVERNSILRPSFGGIRIGCSGPGVLDVTIEQNVIETGNGSGIVVQSDARGRMVIKDNKVSVKKPHLKIVNQSKEDLLKLTSDLR